MENGVLTEFTSLHEWNASGWRIYEVSGLGGRNGAALVYHEAEKATFLMAGSTEKQKPVRIFDDVWRWEGKGWKKVDSDCPLKEPRAVYDPANQRILVYGDASDKTRQ